MTKRMRSIVLIVAAAGLTLLLIADRTGVLTQSGSDGSDAREVYLTQASLASRTRAAIEQTGAWRRSLSIAEREWARVKQRMIAAPSAEVAAGRLRRRVEREMRDLGLTLAVSDPLPARTPIEGEPIRVIGLELNFSASNTDEVYRLIDRLENLSDALTNVETLTIDGPGRSMRTGVDISLRLRALAWVGAES